MTLHELELLLEPTIKTLGCTLWGIQWVTKTKPALLRIYIEKNQGVTVEDCAQVSRQISRILDVEQWSDDQYHLEVSSPGLPKPIFKIEQLDQQVGETIKLELYNLFEGRRKFKGILTKYDFEHQLIFIVEHDNEFEIPYELIKKAWLITNFKN